MALLSNGRVTLLCAATLFAASASWSEAADSAPPAWAYPVNPPNFRPAPDKGGAQGGAGGVSFTLTQARDPFSAPDWWPADHGPVPDIVLRGRRPDVWACGYCHRVNGAGGPENARIAGLPAIYSIQQTREMANGARVSSVHNRAPTLLMTSTSKAATDDEIAAATAYFAGLPPPPPIRVLESDTAPRTEVYAWFLRRAEGTEPIGERIIEIADDVERFELRDGRVTITAYVPPGSIARGEDIVRSGGPGGTACAACHGGDLGGLGPVPPIKGISPTYAFRQLYDFQKGRRAGVWSPLMSGVVAGLSDADMISVAAYLAQAR